jgi:CheY-like chemotaxis protein
VVQASVAQESEALPETLRVLVADDMQMNKKLLRRAFLTVRPHWTVTMASTAEEALELVLGAPADAPFELICLDEDFSMAAHGESPMRGSDAIMHIREHETKENMLPAAIVCISGAPAREVYAMAKTSPIGIWGKPYPSVIDGSMQKELKRLLCTR